jgi:flagellin FlaB
LNRDVGSIGIGAMIVFIAMVLVAGIAASVLIQTSTKLEAQAMATGSETTEEVSTGLAVCDIQGYATTGSDMSKIAIMIRARAGSEGIDLAETYIELSDTNKKIILSYQNTTFYSKPDGLDNVFGAAVFPDDDYGYGNVSNEDGSTFGILVVEDADGSFVSATQVVLNGGDKAFLCVNATGCFNDIVERTDISGMIVPEQGSPGIISFTTPASYSDANVFDLQ